MNFSSLGAHGRKLWARVRGRSARPVRRAVRGRAGTWRAGDSRDGVTLRTLLEVLGRRSRLIGKVVLAGAIGVAALAWLMPARYTATAQVIIENAPRGPGSAALGPDQASIQTEVTAISSYDLLAKVVGQLAADPAFRHIERRGAAPIPDLAVSADRARVVSRLKKHLQVFQEHGSHVVSIAYTSRNPAEAAAIANRITAYYLATGGVQSRLARNQVLAVLKPKLAELRSEFQSRQAAVAAYEAAHGEDAYRSNVLDQEFAHLNGQLSLAQAKLAASRARYAALSALRGAHGDWRHLLSGLDMRGLFELHEQAAAVLAGRQQSIYFAPPAAASVAAESSTLAPLRAKVRRELDQDVLKLSSDERVAVAQRAAVQARLRAVRAVSDDRQLHSLVAAAAGAQQRYQRLLQHRNRLLEQADDVLAPARLLTWAPVPQRPSSLSPALLIGPALVAFLVLGGLAALWRDQLDQGIYDEDDVASVLGVRCAGFIRKARDMSLGGEIARTRFTGHWQELRAIMVSLQLVRQRRHKPQVILVTSSVAGEGKSTLVRGLAACEAAAGSKVLLLDCNERMATEFAPQPTVSVAGQGAPGTVLPHEHALTELIPAPTGEGLDYLPIEHGSAVQPSVRLSIKRMSGLLKRFRSDYDLILIDSAAVLEYPEVRLLAALADQILFTVQWGKTRRNDACAALDLLRTCGPNGTETKAAICVAITQWDAGGSAGRMLE